MRVIWGREEETNGLRPFVSDDRPSEEGGFYFSKIPPTSDGSNTDNEGGQNWRGVGVEESGGL